VYPLDYRDALFKIKVPVLYLANTTNPSHLFEVAKETADGMINAEVTFVPFENCGLVQFDAKERGVDEIRRFLKKYFV